MVSLFGTIGKLRGEWNCYLRINIKKLDRKVWKIIKLSPEDNRQEEDVEDGAEDDDGQVEAEKEVKSVLWHLGMPLEQADWLKKS